MFIRVTYGSTKLVPKTDDLLILQNALGHVTIAQKVCILVSAITVLHTRDVSHHDE